MKKKSAVTEYQMKKTGRLIPCPGEAHSNPYIDNCMICAPRWGEIEELEPVNLEEARAQGLDIRMTDFRHGPEFDAAKKLIESGEATLVNVDRKKSYGSVNYNVLRWVKK